jgi:hypothetical protein
MTRRLVPFLAAAAILAPHAASAAVSLEVFYGLSRPKAADFSQAVSGTADDPDLYDDSLNVAGGSVLLHLGLLELGAIVDTSWKSGSASQTAIGGLAGVGGDVGGWLRLELLGEVGAQRYGNFAEDPDVVTASSSEEWLAYVGLRPGVAVRVPIGETRKTAVLVGIWGFARWDVTDSTVPVTVGSAGDASAGELELGGTTIGAALRLGLDF